MTSQIISDNIANSVDETYPVAGQDNDSQGFRDNFTAIKNGLTVAGNEITDLQNNTAKTNNDNNFNGYLIDNAQTNRVYGKAFDNGSVSGAVTIDYEKGEYQTFTLTGNVTFTFRNWPDVEDSFSKLRISIRPVNASNYTATFLTINGSVISQSPTSTFETGSNPDVSKVIEAWTQKNTTGGKNVYLSVLGNFNISFGLNDLSDVVLTTPSEGNFLKYIGGVWKNSAIAPAVQIDSLHEDIGNVVVNSLTTNDILVYGAGTNWVNVPMIRQLDQLDDVTVATPIVGETIRYTGFGSPPLWRNEKDPNLVQYALYVSDNLSITDEFYFGNPAAGGTPISNSGNIMLFHIGNIYRFNLSNASNTRAPLRFSSTKPSVTVTGYTNNVTISGIPGTPGSYVDILITKDTPHVLYMYGDVTGTANQPQDAGRDIPIYINTKGYYTGSIQTVSGTAIDSLKSVTYFITTGPSTSSLSTGYDGQIKTLIMYTDGGDMVVSVSNSGWGGSGTLTFNAVGQSCTLQYINSKWFVISNNGVSIT